MNDIDRWADDPMWDDETSRLVYQLPLDLTREEAARQGEELKAGIPAEEVYMTAQYMCAKSPQTHRAAFKHAIDFLVRDGTKVLAANAGMVVEVQEQSNEWGDSLEFRDKLNYVTISHAPSGAPNEFTQYCHIAQYSVREAGLSVGATVQAGQVIATVGKTGLTDRDHLHFIVFRLDKNPSPFGFKSLVPKWE